MTRLKAFSIHLGISFVIFLVILYFILFHWYPQPFFTTDGGWQGIRIVAGVDMVLGPLLTLIVFKPGKPSLKIDMSIIALIQTVALISGTWIVHKESPVAVVFADDKFRPIPSYQFEEAGMKISQLKDYGIKKPVLIFTHLPENQDELQKARLEAYQKQKPLYLQGDRYQSVNEENIARLSKQNIDMTEYLKDKGEKEKNIYQNFIQQHPNAEKNLIFLPLHSRYENFIIAFNPETVEFVQALKIKPPTDFSDGRVIDLSKHRKQANETEKDASTEAKMKQ